MEEADCQGGEEDQALVEEGVAVGFGGREGALDQS